MRAYRITLRIQAETKAQAVRELTLRAPNCLGCKVRQENGREPIIRASLVR